MLTPWSPAHPPCIPLFALPSPARLLAHRASGYHLAPNSCAPRRTAAVGLAFRTCTDPIRDCTMCRSRAADQTGRSRPRPTSPPRPRTVGAARGTLEGNCSEAAPPIPVALLAVPDLPAARDTVRCLARAPHRSPLQACRKGASPEPRQGPVRVCPRAISRPPPTPRGHDFCIRWERRSGSSLPKSACAT